MITFISLVFFTGLSVISCNAASKKDITDANANLKEVAKHIKEAAVASNDTAKANAIANWESFKNQSETAINGMEKDVAILEAKIVKAADAAKKSLKADLEKTKIKVDELKVKLKKRNAEFEIDIAKFDAIATAKNQSFQREFKHDLNELGSAIKDLFKNNVE